MARIRQQGWVIAATVAALLAVLIPPAAAHDYRVGDLAIVHPWARATPEGAKVASGYVTIHNKGASPERLVSIASEISEKAEIHEMAVDHKGVMSMRPVTGGMEIPAGERIVLKPGSHHVMFTGLKRPTVKDKRFAVTLIFERTGPVEIEFMVQEMAGPQKHHHQPGAHGT